MKVFVSKEIRQSGIDLLENSGISVTVNKKEEDLSQEALKEICRGYDALLCVGRYTIDKDFLMANKHLKGIALHSVGYDNVDIETATKLGIPIGNTPEVLNKATSDIAFLLMLAVSRNAFFMHKKIRKGEWTSLSLTEHLGRELYGCTLGIFGLGRIGLEMARKCVAAYNMRIIYHNRHKNTDAEKELGAQYVPFDELLRQSDVLSIHANLSDETSQLFNSEAFRQMKKNAIFINTARGGLHNESDLIEALQNGTIWGAGLDVTNPEPMQKENPLLRMPNVCVLPHIGSATIETRNKMAEMAARNIIAALNGKPMPTVVNAKVYG